MHSLLPLFYVTAFIVCCLPDLIDATFGRFGQRSRMHVQSSASPLRKRHATAPLPEPRYCSDKTEPFLVESLPDVPYELGEMYSGLIPIDYANTSEALFFIFQPKLGEPVDEITIWLNGGPGCSSLKGFFQENGRFVWLPGTYGPVENPYTWVNLTNMLWVEQPIGTGYSIGTPKATTEEEIAQDFIKFFKNFELLFGISNYNIYVTGESYAGRYVPYVSAAMLDQNDSEFYNLSGALVYDPSIGDFDYTQQELVVVPFAVENNNILNLNASFLTTMEGLHQSCGYADYIEKYLTFPASGVQPPVFFDYTSDADCDVFDMINNALLAVNPCFDIYQITQICPLLYDVLGFPTEITYISPGSEIYFNRTDVKKALHAPLDVSWYPCSLEPVFVGNISGPEEEGDDSADPIQHVLPQVIEATNRVLISNGDYDMIIINNGTLLSIQNMTWNGKLGFEARPSTPINITLIDLMYESVFDDEYNALYYAGLDGPQGIMGIQHYERGLMWAQTYQSGHMQPQFQPRTTYRHLMWLLRQTEVI